MNSETDWQFLLGTALLHHQLWSQGRLELAAEIRLREGKFGATPADRASLRLEIHHQQPTPRVLESDEENPPSLGRAHERRARLLKDAGEVSSLDEKRAADVLKKLDEKG